MERTRYVLVGRWQNGPTVPNGIFWRDAETATLFEAMQRYITTGECMEILKYAPRSCANAGEVYDEREAHGED